MVGVRLKRLCAAHDICGAPQLCARTKYIRCTLSWCCRGAATLGQLGYAGLHSGGCCHSGQQQEDGCLGPDDGVTGSKVHRVVMGFGASSHGLVSDATLAQDKNCGCGFIPAIHFDFPPTTLGEQSLCYCRHAVSICYTKPTTGLSHLGGGFLGMKRDFVYIYIYIYI